MMLGKPPPPLSQDVDLSKTYDAVIVGSGAAGGMAAHVLTEQGMDVLMLEAGEKVDIKQNSPKVRSMQWALDQPPRGGAPPRYPLPSVHQHTLPHPPHPQRKTVNQGEA